MPLPSSTHVLPLARKRKLVPELARALSRAEDRQAQPLMRLLRQALALGHQLEDEVRQIRVTEPASPSTDRMLEAMLDLSMELGRVLRKARELGEGEELSRSLHEA